MYFSDTFASDATGHCWTERCTNGIQQLLPSCSVQITLGFIHVAAPIVFCPNLGEGRRQKIGGSNILLSGKLLRNIEEMVLTQFWKRNCCSAETKHDTQRTAWGEVGEGVQIWLLNMKNTVLLFWFINQVIACTVNFKALEMWKISAPS